MSGITETTKNEKTLSNTSVGGDTTWDDATITWDDAERPWNALGLPITKTSKNEKALSNISENP